MQTGEWDTIYRAVGASMAVAWAAPTDEAFAYQMTTLCQTLWGHLRDDPFPADPEALAYHLAGVNQNDPEGFVKRLLSYERGPMN